MQQLARTEEDFMIAVEVRAQQLLKERKGEIRAEIACETFQDRIEERAREIACEKFESIKDDLRRGVIYETHEDEIREIAQELVHSRLQELEHKLERSSSMAERQAEMIDLLYEGSEVLKSLGVKSIKDLVAKFEEMRKKIVELEGKLRKKEKDWRTDATAAVE